MHYLQWKSDHISPPTFPSPVSGYSTVSTSTSYGCMFYLEQKINNIFVSCACMHTCGCIFSYYRQEDYAT